MAIPTFTVPCLSKETLAQGVIAFTLKKPEGFTFKAGQFVLFDVALKDNPEDVQTRAFSIASSPAETELLFVAKMKEGGRASVWIEEMLEVGTEVTMKGPFGNFTFDQTSEHNVLFVATSTGIAPFRSQILDACAAGDRRRMDVIFGVRHEDDLFWKEEFERIAQTYDNVWLHIALSKPSESWSGHIGRVQTLMPLIAKDMHERCVYVCGSPDMTKEVKQLCLEEWHVEKKNLHVEGYI